MDAHDRISALRRLIAVERHEREPDRSELSALRRGLLEPIEDDERGRHDDSAALLAHVGRSWGP